MQFLIYKNKMIYNFKEYVLSENKRNYILDNDNCEYYVRYSDYIEEDFKRGWSSWNFGLDGFDGTKDELLNTLYEHKNDNRSFQISGFNIWLDEDTNIDYNTDTVYVDDYIIKELYDNYFVCVDVINARNGLSAHILPDNLNNLNDILNHIKQYKYKYDGTGDGQSFSPDDAKVIYIEDDMNIIEVGENTIKNI